MSSLDGLVFALAGKFTVSQAEVKQLITENGGCVAGSITKKVTHLLTTKADADHPRVKQAKVCALSLCLSFFLF